jgi:DNA-directed RNA polymerase subunit H (RpoH/RPB5)
MSSFASYSPIIAKVYKSRNIFLEILAARGYDISDYAGFSVNEIHVMYNAIPKQLDMMLENNTTHTKCYIKYHLGKKLKQNHIEEVMDDLYDTEEILTNDDELIIVCKNKINDKLKENMQQIFINEGKFYSVYNLNDYLFNVLKHDLVPPHRILSDEERAIIFEKYNITTMSQLPEVSRFDPVAQALGMRPDQVCEIQRPSPTAIIAPYYRICCQ